ncbi:MAG TPA: methyltransferase domain-containing protein [Candidatus Methanoperedens sp.]|nr:methyltransferase domain-containing protein [Candidatus Methanoperedens sp.]
MSGASAAEGHGAEVAQGERFRFGENWRAFLATLDEERIRAAEASLAGRLGLESLAGRSFLDVGCGSGLFSLAARRLGARVRSFDFDPQSVACCSELRRRYFPEDPGWTIEEGSALDAAYLASLGAFDVVYSWGVLHHTGDLRRALALAAERTAPGGLLFVAIYNDQGGASRRWLKVKRAYNALPRPLRPPLVAAIAGWYEARHAAARLLAGGGAEERGRGMSRWHDWVDWVGGLPFEVARPEQVILPLQAAGFGLVNLVTVGAGWGCNEYVLRRLPS